MRKRPTCSYETKNLDEFVYELGKGILAELRSKGRKVWETFLDVVHSLRSTISFDINGNPEWSAGIGDATSSPTTRGCISSATSFSHAILPEGTRSQSETERTYRKRRTATESGRTLPGAEGQLPGRKDFGELEVRVLLLQPADLCL